MNKAFYLYIVYANCGSTSKGFDPVVFRLEFNDKATAKGWLEDSNNLKGAVIAHAMFMGIKPGAVFLKAVYADSEMCEALGLPDDGSKLEDVIACLFKRWFVRKQQSGAFPTV